jgi:hypothetical protein
MQSYKYTVTNSDGKKMSGTIDAPSEDVARKELNELGFSILHLDEYDSTKEKKDSKKKFFFEALDKEGKFINGTVPAETKEEAIQKLNQNYQINVSALWPENASVEEITKARKEGLNQGSPEETPATEQVNENALKINKILEDIQKLIETQNQNLDEPSKKIVDQKINKLMRIKNSTNENYIVKTASDLLQTIDNLTENSVDVRVKTKEILDKLTKNQKNKSFSEDILDKIDSWQNKHTQEIKSGKTGTSIVNNILEKVKQSFQKPLEIAALEDQIKAYNRQIWEFIKLYFKEPTKEYKQQVKENIKKIFKARKKAKTNLKTLKKELKKRRELGEEKIGSSFLKELNNFSGWLLFFYLAYYFTGLYIHNKNFGVNLENLPEALDIYQTSLFKYLLVIIFLLHSATAIKIHFFKKSKIASALLIISFIVLSLITILNF